MISMGTPNTCEHIDAVAPPAASATPCAIGGRSNVSHSPLARALTTSSVLR
jgi:hypothetical protein